MRLLDRYLLREFLVPLGYCLGGFVILWDAFQLFSELHSMQEKGLRALDVVGYFFFKTPEFFLVVLPVALLLALLYTLTYHARHNEITAIRTAGVSLWRLCLPYFVVGFASALALFAVDEFCAPIASETAEQILTRRVHRRLSVEERQQIKNVDFVNSPRSGERRVWHIGIYNLVTGEMNNPVLTWDFPDGSSLLIRADRAVRTNQVWTFYRVRQLEQTTPTNAFPVKRPSADVMPFPKLSETPRDIKNQISINESLNLNSGNRTRKADIPIMEILNYLRIDPNPPSSIRPKLYTKLHGRFAGPCACVVVVLIAIPFAAGPGRRNVFVSVGASISISFVYFLLQQMGFALGETGRLAAWLAAWFPNLLFAFTGLWLMARIR